MGGGGLRWWWGGKQGRRPDLPAPLETWGLRAAPLSLSEPHLLSPAPRAPGTRHAPHRAGSCAWGHLSAPPHTQSRRGHSPTGKGTGFSVTLLLLPPGRVPGAGLSASPGSSAVPGLPQICHVEHPQFVTAPPPPPRRRRQGCGDSEAVQASHPPAPCSANPPSDPKPDPSAASTHCRGHAAWGGLGPPPFPGLEKAPPRYPRRAALCARGDSGRDSGRDRVPGAVPGRAASPAGSGVSLEGFIPRRMSMAQFRWKVTSSMGNCW